MESSGFSHLLALTARIRRWRRQRTMFLGCFRSRAGWFGDESGRRGWILVDTARCWPGRLRSGP